MPAKSDSSIVVAMALLAGILTATSARAQDASATSLADQLIAQYKLAKIVPAANSYKVDQPGTLLIVQKAGIVGVPIGNNPVEPVVYDIQKDPALHHSPATGSGWKFEVGHKVYLTKLDIDAKHDKVLFMIIECDCGDPGKPLYYKSVIDFEFPKGYLTSAEAGQIESVIDQVLTIDDRGKATPLEPVDSGPTSCSANDEIIKLVQVKMPDSVVLAKIKSASCDFDTNTDALVKLKRAGASDAVLQAIMDVPPKPVAFSCPDYGACISAGKTALGSSQWDDAIAAFQAASTFDASKPDAWAGMGNAYLGANRKEEAAAMWDKALVAGGPLTFAACHIRGFNTCEWGNLVLGPKNVSFTLSAGQQLFAAQPSQAVSPRANQYPAAEGQPSPRIVVLSFKAGGKNYRFYLIPFGVACNSGPAVVRVVCPDEGSAQALVISNYISQAIPKLASGALGSSPQ